MSSENKPAAVKATRVPIVGNLERGVDEIDKVLASGNTDLEMDFAACTFVAVDGLEWLEELLLRADSQKRIVSFVNVSPPLYKVFKISHIESLMRAAGGAGRAHMGPAC